VPEYPADYIDASYLANDTTMRGYDASGNAVSGCKRGWQTHSRKEESRSYYGAGDRLAAVRSYVEIQPTPYMTNRRGSLVEYRYDALGRRVLVRTTRDGVCVTGSTDVGLHQRHRALRIRGRQRDQSVRRDAGHSEPNRRVEANPWKSEPHSTGVESGGGTSQDRHPGWTLPKRTLVSTTPRPDDLSPWHDADTLLQRIYQIGREPVPALREPLLRLTEHDDPDLREEALRILGTRWKDPGVRPRILSVIRDDTAPEVRSAALIALAACASDATRITDTRLLVRRLSDEGEDTEVRGAAYDALIIMYRKKGKDDGWPFPTARRAFDAVRDVDWDWVRSLGDGLLPPDSAASGA
jgi:hypothetical protein